MIPSRPFALAAPLLAFACGGASGTQPHDVSAADHLSQAAHESSQADAHVANPSAKCAPGKGRVCWTDSTSPTEEHEKLAQEHRDRAQAHRAAAQSLADAEARACVDVTEQDRDMSPFAHREDVLSVRELVDIGHGDRDGETEQVGATIVIRAVPGLTKEWLQHIVDCHLARNAAVGHDMPEMPYCPLVPRGVQAVVRSAGGGFAVDVRSERAQTADEIWTRAQRLSPQR
jgi:hypothetical protein